MSKKRILFIVNPISGHRDKSRFRDQVAGEFGGGDFSCEVVFTERAGHAAELSAEAVGVYDIVAAVGGDGTLNEVARSLVGTDTAMAVIPCGSGNGLARCLHIPTDTGRALRLLRSGCVRRIDTATVNGRFFLSVAGIGLDAQTAFDFAQDPRRGFIPYAYYASSNYFHLKPETVTLTFDGRETLTCSPMLVTFANSNQYGYNAVIAPHASLQDGLLDTCILSRPPLPVLPAFVTMLMNGLLDRSRYLTEIQASHITVERPSAGVVNLDGDPVMMEAVLDVRVVPGSLGMVCR
jgi:YegS/Rv2252/BmrU family lipid kinase